ncbi:hypothetical protein CsSME_00046168 [Camellia sinensis var. sinensis]
MQSLTWPLPFANLLTLVFELNGLSMDSNEEIDRVYLTFSQREWQHSISRIPQQVGAPVDEAQDPVYDQPPHPVSLVPPKGHSFYMTREEYLQLQHSVDQVHSTLHDHHQSLMELHTDFQAYRDYSQVAFDQLNARQLDIQQSVASLQTDFYTYRESSQQCFDQLGQRVQNEAFETCSLMNALFAQHFPPPPPPNSP